jgi:hypothetical protein
MAAVKECGMALTLRRTRIKQSHAFARLKDWDVLDDGKPVGRIYQRHAQGKPGQAWFWSITEYVEPRSGVCTSSPAATLLEAKAAFKAHWLRWCAWAARTGFDRARL